MIGALSSATSSLLAQSRVLDNTSNNLANVNTPGFKNARVNLRDTGAGSGVAVGSVSRETSQGPIQVTNRSLDLAIAGEGFFQVQLPNGNTAYTRDGSLSVADNGQLVTSGGLPVQPGIVIPADASEISVASDGTVSAVGPNGPQVVGNLTLARFPNAAGLLNAGNNLQFASNAAGDPIVGVPGEAGLGTVEQGALEGSNVDLVSNFASLLISQRTFEAGTKVVRVQDDILGETVNLVG